MKDEIIDKMFNRNELRRLEKAAREKNKTKLMEWAVDFETRLSENYNKLYLQKYASELSERLKDLDIAVIYALHFSENTRFGNKRLKSFMEDLSATMKGFYKDKYSREEYRKMLEDDGIKIEKD